VQWVVLKMLPFDNKSEFQVVLEMPAGTPLETPPPRCRRWAPTWRRSPRCVMCRAMPARHQPITFNGLVRQYYLRADAEQGDLQVNLVDKAHRTSRAMRSRSACARNSRIAARHGAR
jgi:hypothetical protein